MPASGFLRGAFREEISEGAGTAPASSRLRYVATSPEFYPAVASRELAARQGSGEACRLALPRHLPAGDVVRAGGSLPQHRAAAHLEIHQRLQFLSFQSRLQGCIAFHVDGLSNHPGEITATRGTCRSKHAPPPTTALRGIEYSPLAIPVRQEIGMGCRVSSRRPLVPSIGATCRPRGGARRGPAARRR